MAIINPIKHKRTSRAQAMVEFALALPILMIVIFGLIETGRLIYFNTTVISAAREGARYGSASGNIGGTVQYRDCDAIKTAALRVDAVHFLSAADINIQYDHGPGTTIFASCGPTVTLASGDRVVVTATGHFQLFAGIIPGFRTHAYASTSERTILGKVQVTGAVVPVPPGLSVTVSGNGSVTSSDGQITCPSTCSGTYQNGDTVTLTASSSYVFLGWGGSCAAMGTSPTCTLTISADTSVFANFDGAKTLNVTNVSNGGTGTVTTVPAGINCGSTCSATFANVTVTLTATPNAGSSFTGWGGDCSGTGVCQVTMDIDHNVTANFGPPGFQVTLLFGGTGGGTVTSTPAGLNCSSDCIYAFLPGPVTLHATPFGGSVFTGWTSAVCSGTGDCNFTIGGPTTITASFDTATKLLNVNKTGTGTGTVTSSPAGINCGGTCNYAFNTGTVVTLTATATSPSTFTGWTGGGCSGTGTCTVTMNAITTVAANFDPPANKTLTVTMAGVSSGGGTVTSSPAGIACITTPSICSYAFAYGTPVTLTAVPDSNSTFTGWSGDCSGTGTCNVTMNAVHNVTATFTHIALPPCTFTGSIPVRSSNKKTFTWTVTNNTTPPIPLAIDHLFVNWSDGTLNLNDVSLGGTSLWSGTHAPGITITVSGKSLAPGANSFTFTLSGQFKVSGANFTVTLYLVPSNCSALTDVYTAP